MLVDATAAEKGSRRAVSRASPWLGFYFAAGVAGWNEFVALFVSCCAPFS